MKTWCVILYKMQRVLPFYVNLNLFLFLFLFQFLLPLPILLLFPIINLDTKLDFQGLASRDDQVREDAGNEQGGHGLGLTDGPPQVQEQVGQAPRYLRYTTGGNRSMSELVVRALRRCGSHYSLLLVLTHSLEGESERRWCITCGGS